MGIYADILAKLPVGEVIEVRIGTHWTAVVVMKRGERHCGLASTLVSGHDHHREPDVPQAGHLHELGARELAGLIQSGQSVMASVATATINALLPRGPWGKGEKNAEEVIAAAGVGKTVAVIGRFPFNARLKSQVGRLYVLEQHPQGEDLPEQAAPEILPDADIVAITGMAFSNGTLQRLIDLCSPEAMVLVLGPSTPLSPVLFEHGVHLLSGALVRDIEGVLRTLSQGGNFRQIHKAGVQLVTLDRNDFQFLETG
jgi:uncharacterized protein (DUF4213/DUF364 family)